MEAINSTPKQYLCPLSDIAMTKPMHHLTTGLRFEEDAIMGWIKDGNTSCPITGESLNHRRDLVLDIRLEREIQEWRQGKLMGIRDRILNHRQALLLEKLQRKGSEVKDKKYIIKGAGSVSARKFTANSARKH